MRLARLALRRMWTGIFRRCDAAYFTAGLRPAGEVSRICVAGLFQVRRRRRLPSAKPPKYLPREFYFANFPYCIGKFRLWARSEIAPADELFRSAVRKHRLRENEWSDCNLPRASRRASRILQGGGAFYRADKRGLFRGLAKAALWTERKSLPRRRSGFCERRVSANSAGYTRRSGRI